MTKNYIFQICVKLNNTGSFHVKYPFEVIFYKEEQRHIWACIRMLVVTGELETQKLNVGSLVVNFNFLFAVGESPSPVRNNNNHTKYVNYQNMRRSQTPNPELGSQDSGMSAPERRAITPGPEWGHHPGQYNSNEDLAGAKDNVHYRQPSYLTAMDGVDQHHHHHQHHHHPYDHHGYPPSSGYDHNPYGTVAASRSNYPASSVAGSTYSGSHTLPARSSSYHPAQQTVPQYTSSTPIPQHHHEHSYNRSHSQPAHSSQHTRDTQQYQQQSQYPSQDSCQPTGYGSSRSQPHSHTYGSYQGHSVQSHSNSSQVPSKPQPSHQGANLSNQDYNDWTLSTSEQYRRQTPISPTKEKTRPVYPSSPQKGTQGKGGDIQRMESFTKGSNGADVVRYPKNIHDEYPLEQYQRNRSNSQDGILADRNGPYGEISKPQSTDFQNAMKRARSLENTAAAAEQAAAVRPGPPPVSRTRPASARPYDYGHQKPVVHQHSQPPRSASTQPDKQPTIKYPDPEYVTHEEIMKQNSGLRGSSGIDMADGSLYPQQKRMSSRPEDNYATLNMRKKVENILHLQNRMRPKVPSGNSTSSATSYTSSNTSLDTPPPVFKDTLQVDIPGDNISIGSNMSKSDSGYRSGDRNSASSASSGVDSPLPESHRQYGKTAFVYGNYDPKANIHSSNDSLDSAQSGQSCATLTNKSTSGQPLSNIPENVMTGYPPHGKDSKRQEPPASPVVSAVFIAQQGNKRASQLSMT